MIRNVRSNPDIDNLVPLAKQDEIAVLNLLGKGAKLSEFIARDIPYLYLLCIRSILEGTVFTWPHQHHVMVKKELRVIAPMVA